MPGEALINIEVNEAQRADLAGTLANVANGVNRAISGAINKTIRKARTRLVKAAGEVLNLKVGEVRDRIGNPKLASPEDLSASVTATRAAVPAYKFPHQEVRFGVTVQMRRGGGYELLEAQDNQGTFLATMPNSKGGIWEHSPKGEVRRKKVVKVVDGKVVTYRSQLPIAQKYGLTVVGSLLGRGILRGEREWAAAEMVRQLDSQIDRFTKPGPLPAAES